MVKKKNSLFKIEYAFDINGKKTYPEKAEYGQVYYVGKSKQEVFLKISMNNKPFFCRKTNAEITREVIGIGNQMSVWHKRMKLFFNGSNCEVSFYKNEERHQADVHINDCVIEFQHSDISVNEFKSRNEAYKKLGKNLLWIFHKYSENNEHIIPSDNEYKLNIPCLRDFDFNNQNHNGILIFIHYNNDILSKNFYNIRGYIKKENKFLFSKATTLIKILEEEELYTPSRLIDILENCEGATIKCLNKDNDRIYFISNNSKPSVKDEKTKEIVTDLMMESQCNACWEIIRIIC